jgi:hypothetical protein
MSALALDWTTGVQSQALLLLVTAHRPTVGTTAGPVSSGIKRTEREAVTAPPSSADVENALSLPYTVLWPYAQELQQIYLQLFYLTK